MGIFSKNREEWALTQLACYYMSITQVTYYDTLGEEAVAFINDQTQLTTISCSANYIKMLAAMKKEGRAQYLQNLVIWDSI